MTAQTISDTQTSTLVDELDHLGDLLLRNEPVSYEHISSRAQEVRALGGHEASSLAEQLEAEALQVRVGEKASHQNLRCISQTVWELLKTRQLLRSAVTSLRAGTPVDIERLRTAIADLLEEAAIGGACGALDPHASAVAVADAVLGRAA